MASSRHSLQAHAPPARELRIVVADHDQGDRERVCGLLRAEQGFRVEEAANQAALMALLAAGDVDCVTVDRMLGTEGGFDVHDRIKSRFVAPPAVIMLITGGDELAATKALRRGFSDYVKKTSLNPRELINAIVHAADRRRAETRQRADQEQLARLSLRDRLTGLPNRSVMEERLALLISGTKRHGKPFAVLKIDIDGLKRINDGFGLSVGDAALKAFADRLKEVSRTSDIFGRLGGDDFLYLIDGNVTSATAELACQRLATALSFTFETESVGLQLSANVGAAICPADGKTAGEILGAADRALQVTKLSGGGYALSAASLDAAISAPQPRRPAHEEAAPFRAGPVADAASAGESLAVLARPGADGGGPIHRHENRRGTRRHRVLKRGMIVINDGYSTVNCLIRDLSENGARITTEDGYLGHGTFSLVIIESGKRYAAETRWQKGREIGLKFLE